MRRLALLASALLVAGALARADDRATGAIYLDVLEGDAAAALAEGDAAARAGDFARAALRYQQLLDRADGPLRDRLVDLAATPGARRRAAAGTAYASLPVALRARLAALPPAGLAAYRARVDAAAGALAAAAMRARDRAALEAVVARHLFASRGVEAATLLGDLYLEEGDLVGALSTFETAAEVPGAAADLAPRIAGARARLEAADAAAGALAGQALGAASAGLPADARPGARRLASFDEGDGAALLDCPPIAIPGGLAVVRPGRALLLRPGAGAVGERVLPPAAGATPGPTPGPFALGGACGGGLLAVAIERSRFIEGSDAADLAAAARRSRRGRGQAAPRALETTGRGGIFAVAYDLYAFDLARDDRLLFTTAEASAFGPDAAWLATVEWAASPVVAPGLVFGAATGRAGEPEIHVAAIEASASPRLRWRTFLCARGYVPPDERGEGAPVEPALARDGRRLLVDSGVGLLAALDAHRGEVLWALRRPGAAEERREARTVLRGEPEPQALSDRPTVAPRIFAAARAPAAPGETARDVAVFAPRLDGLVALDVETGEVAWIASGESPVIPVARWRDALAVVEDGALTLIDAGRAGRREGKRRASPLPLPAEAPTGRGGPAVAPVVGAGAAIGDRIAVPLAGYLLIVRVDAAGGGFALAPERAVAIAPEGRADAIALGDALAVVDAGEVALVPPEAPEEVPGAAPATEAASPSETAVAIPRAWDDALSVLEAYGVARDPALVDALVGAATNPTATATPSRAAPAVAPAASDLFRVTADAGPGRLRFTPAAQPPRARVALVLDLATRSLRAEVAPRAEE